MIEESIINYFAVSLCGIRQSQGIGIGNLVGLVDKCSKERHNKVV